MISGKPTPEPKNYVIKDQYDFVSEFETKTFDNCRIISNNKKTNSSMNLQIKNKTNSGSRKREKPWNRAIQKRESPYSSQPKADHIRSKSSYIKGPSSFKSIIQKYRERGISGNNSKDLKISKNKHFLSSPSKKNAFQVENIKFKTKKSTSKPRRVLKNDSISSQSHSLNTRNRSTKRSDLLKKQAHQKKASGTLIPNEYSNKFAKSPTVPKHKSLTNKISISRKNIMDPKNQSSDTSVYGKRETSKSKAQIGKKDILTKDRMAKSYHPGSNTGHDIYSSMFSDGSGINSQLSSMIFPQRPGSNTSMAANTDFIANNVETSQNSLRHAIMSVLKTEKAITDPVLSIQEGGTPLDERFTKSLQIYSPSSKFSHRESKPAVKSPSKRIVLKYKTTLHGHSNTVNSLAFDTKCYSYLFSGSHDYSIKVWHCTSFSPRNVIDLDSEYSRLDRCYKTLNLHTKKVNCLQYLPISSVLVSAGADQRLCLVNTENTEEFDTLAIFRRRYGNVNQMISMASGGFEMDEAKLFTASLDKKILLIDLNNHGDIISEFYNPDGNINCFKMQTSNNFLLIADCSSKVKLWDVKSGKTVNSFNGPGRSKTCIENYDNDCFITTSNDGILSIWDYRMPKKPVKSSLIKDNNLSGYPNSHFNQLLYTKGTIFAATDQGLSLINPRSLEVLEQRRNHEGSVQALAYCELDGTMFSSSHDKSVVVWSLR
ncbi:unnamed protein product [Moneuplotes crassus]|uniref:Uncharacterized protein n=2 Tax=Euplotes crassus TaxID=5936 RepID=A0AAD2CX72_EUPCR|nr:unnamed protein product [Moneuplotes crassus]